MRLQGAESGKVKLISQPIEVLLVTDGLDADVHAARMRWVPPLVHSICRAASDFYLSRLYGRSPTAAELEQDQKLVAMSWSCVQDDGAYKTPVFAFPDIIDPRTRCLVQKDDLLFDAMHDAAIRRQCAAPAVLVNAYDDFQLTEFPDHATEEQLEALFEEAKKKSLVTLLSERGYWTILRSLRGMGRRAAESARGNTGAGRP